MSREIFIELDIYADEMPPLDVIQVETIDVKTQADITSLEEEG